MKRWPVVCVFAWAVAAAVAADASFSELAPPGTKVVIGINCRGLLDSPLSKKLVGQDRDMAAQMAQGMNLAGFDFLKDLDQVWILSTGTSDKVLAVMRGRFDAEKLAAGAKRYKGIPVLDAKAGGGSAIGLISSETAVAGDTADVQAAIDRAGSGSQLDAELKARVDAVADRYDIWGIGEVPEGIANPAAGAGGPGSIDRFMFGVTVRQGLTVTAEFHGRSTEDAAKMTAMLSMMEAAFKTQMKDARAAFDVQQENGTFRISVTMPEEELRKVIQAQRSGMMAALAQRAPGDAAKAGGERAGQETAAAPGPAPAPLPTLIGPQPGVVVAPPVPPKSQNQTQVVRAPNGDTMILKLPGSR